MLCPLKFSHYEFEGGQDCIGSECGMHKLCNANDALAAENDVSEASVDANDASVDTREKLEADVRQILHSAYMFAWMHGNENRRGGSFKNLHREFYNLLDRQEEITERECERHWMQIVGASANANVELKRQIDERQARVDELTAENAKLSSDELHLRQAFASAEFDNATLRDKLGRMLDNAHEITRIGGDC